MRLHIFHGFVENLDRIHTALARHAVKCTIDNPFSGGFFTIQHHRIDEFRQHEVTEFRIRDDLTFFCTMTT